MSIEVKFYTLSKKRNSTKIPADNGTVFNCNLIESCSFSNPRVTLLFDSNAQNPTAYNYAFIPSFDRFYYVENWTYTNRCWIADLTIDVLASWRVSIGNTTQYILRTSDAEIWNPYITDNKYPATSGTNSVVTNPSSNPFATSISGGCFVLGLLGGPAPDVSMATYYVFTSAQFKEFVRALFADRNFLDQFGQSFWNPLQYVISCQWYPFSASEISGVETNTIFFGWWSFNATCKAISIASNYVKTFEMLFTLDTHPQQAGRGAYMNGAPFTRRTIIWNPIGVIPLDTVALSNSQFVVLKVDIDIQTGSGTYTVNKGGAIPIDSGTCHLSVNMPLSQTAVNTFGLVQSPLSLIEAVASGNILGVAQGITSAVNNALPQTKTVGGVGSFQAFITNPPVMRSDFMSVVEADVSRFGRPLFQLWKVSELGGYMEIGSPVIEFACTDHEKADIITFMENGFYYE